MLEALLIIAKMLPEEQILKDVVTSIETYVSDNTEENKSKMIMHLIIATTKFSNEKKELSEMLSDFKRNEEIHKMFKNKDQ